MARETRMVAGLILTVLGMTSCGCVAHHHGISHPRDYGTIGTTPHCVSSALTRDPLFFGHRPTRWREWPSDYVTWRYSTAEDPFRNEEEVIVAPDATESPSPPDNNDAHREELPIAPDPMEADAFQLDNGDPSAIDRLPVAPNDTDSAAVPHDHRDTSPDIGESIDTAADAAAILEATE